MDNDTRQDKGKAAPRKYTVQLTRTGIACVTTGITLALVWVFIFGVLVGRGYHPENSVPELARIIPGPASAPTADAGAANQPAPSAKIISAEELQFPKTLKEEAAPTASPKPTPPATAPVPAPKSVAPDAAKPAAAAEKDSEGNGRFAYIYQVASFKQLDMAEEMSKRLKAAGLATDIESATSNGGSWYRVLVRMTGRPEDTRSLKDTLTGVGLGKPMLRSKKAL